LGTPCYLVTLLLPRSGVEGRGSPLATRKELVFPVEMSARNLSSLLNGNGN